jgi:hypothetical protein
MAKENEGLALSELVRRVGDEHCVIEPVDDCLQGAQSRKDGLTSLRLLTSQYTPGEIVRGDSRTLGLLVWLPRERVEAALADWRAEQSGPNTTEKEG